MASEFRAKNCPRSELFADMAEQDVDKILHAARPLRLEAGSIITSAGESAAYLYFLWKGRARCFYETYNGKKLINIWRIPGQTVGAISLRRRQPAHYLLSSETVQDCVFLVWDSATIRALAKGFPQFLDNAIYGAFEVIAWHIATHACLASETAQERLAHLFLSLGPVIGEKTSDGLALDITNEELADCVVLTVYTVSRILSAWEKIGAISKQRGKVIVHSPERLFVDIPSLWTAPLHTF
jgi:CRP/FNR family transcriptional regulator, nitrogen oxide reductase regulator